MNVIATIIEWLCEALTILIIIRAIMSWVPTSPGNQFVMFLHQLTDPVLNPLRRLIPPIGGTIDITPLIAIVLLQVIGTYVGRLA